MSFQRFLSLETVRLESSQQFTTKDEKLSQKEGSLMDVVSMRRKRSMSSYSREIEEIKNKLVSVSARCQYLENKVARKKVYCSCYSECSVVLRDIKTNCMALETRSSSWLLVHYTIYD